MSPEDNRLLRYLAATVESIRDQMTRLATKEDLERCATKEDFDRCATKEDLDRFATKEDLDRFATKGDVDSLEERVADRIRTLDDRMQSRFGGLTMRVEKLESRSATKDDVTLIRGDIERVQLRIDGVDRTVTTRFDQMDNRISRLRSAVYLLGKDHPDVIRILGEEG